MFFEAPDCQSNVFVVKFGVVRVYELGENQTGDEGERKQDNDNSLYDYGDGISFDFLRQNIKRSKILMVLSIVCAAVYVIICYLHYDGICSKGNNIIPLTIIGILVLESLMIFFWNNLLVNSNEIVYRNEIKRCMDS